MATRKDASFGSSGRMSENYICKVATVLYIGRHNRMSESVDSIIDEYMASLA